MFLYRILALPIIQILSSSIVSRVAAAESKGEEMNKGIRLTQLSTGLKVEAELGNMVCVHMWALWLFVYPTNREQHEELGSC